MSELSRRKILVVDDVAVNRQVIIRVLRGEYDTAEASNGAEALELLRASRDVSAVLLDLSMPVMDGYDTLDHMRSDARLAAIPAIVVTASVDDESQIRALDRGAVDVLTKPIRPEIIRHRLRSVVGRREAVEMREQNRFYAMRLQQQEELLRLSQTDRASGMNNAQTFFARASEHMRAHPQERFVILRWDMDRFKIYNDIYGSAGGDRLLAAIGSAYRSHPQVPSGRLMADHFACCIRQSELDIDRMMSGLTAFLSDYNPDFQFVPRAGLYVVENPEEDAARMCDRALLALRSTKGSMDRQYAWFEDGMRHALVEEQEMVGDMRTALRDGQFEVYLQPQYNYVTGAVCGAEAVARWNHPKKGFITPGTFVPIFERNGFITQLDDYVWERACAILRSWLDSGLPVVPVSVNLSRRDIYNPRVFDRIMEKVTRYKLDPALLSLEITESAYMENADQLIAIVEKLRAAGFTVEMDDFGSGYSSLNMLKDVPVDTLKLDMKFLEGGEKNARSGSILSSVIRMAHWLRLPVIAEGVETKQQADYLKSIGCYYMQGYYFARPMPQREFEALLRRSPGVETGLGQCRGDLSDAVNFFNASNQYTLIFNSFVGAAAIVEVSRDNAEALRMNDQFFDVLGFSREEFCGYQLHIQNCFPKLERAQLFSMFRSAAESGGEAECEVRLSTRKGDRAPRWLRLRARYLAEGQGGCIYCISAENISKRMNQLLDSLNMGQRLADVVESLPYGIVDFCVSDKVELVYFSSRAAEMLSYTRQEFIETYKTSPLGSIHPDDLRFFSANMSILLRGEIKVLNHQMRLVCRDGSSKPVRLVGRVVKTDDDGVQYVSTLIGEVEYPDTYGDVVSGVRSPRAAQSIIPLGIMQYTLEGGKRELTAFNDSAWHIFGYESRQQYVEAVKGKSKVKDTYPEDMPFVESKIEEVMHTDKQVSFEHRILRRDGTVAWVRVILRRISVNDDTMVIQCAFTDISEQKAWKRGHRGPFR